MRAIYVPVMLALASCCGCGRSENGHAVMLGAAGERQAATARRTLDIELLALDLSTCGRCTRTDANLEDAVATVAHVLREADVDVRVRKTVVTSAEQAEALRFASSPTIRINGRDIAPQMRESNCGDCGELCGGAAGGGAGGGAASCSVDCRVWVWQGREFTEAPKAMIIDAMLREFSRIDQPAPHQEPFTLPENLRRFFSARSSASAANSEECCDRETCCEGQAKAACCGAAAPAALCCGT